MHDVDPDGCAGEVGFLGHRDEVTQLPKFHRSIISMIVI
jgi:hypothetical protein